MKAITLKISLYFIFSLLIISACEEKKEKIIPQNSFYGFEVVSHNLPNEIKAGRPLKVKVRLKNTGRGTWPKGDLVFLSYHFFDEKKSPFIREGLRSAIYKSTPPGSYLDLNLSIVPPKNRGKYFFAFNMVVEKIAWFSERGQALKMLPIYVIE